MKSIKHYIKWGVVCAAAVLALPTLAAKDPTNPGYRTNNLISDVQGLAPRTDARVKNPWGVAFDNSRFFVAENGSGLITVHSLNGAIQRAITVPTPAGSSNAISAPTGLALNRSNSFFLSRSLITTNTVTNTVIVTVTNSTGTNVTFVTNTVPTNTFVTNTTGRARSSLVLFATEDGTIGGWNAGSNAVIVVDNSASGAVYKSLALTTSTNGQVLFVANFNSGFVEVYDSGFNHISSFTDTNLAAAGFAPFGMTVIQHSLFVTFAQQAPGKHDDTGTNGFVDVFNLNGDLVRAFAGGAVQLGSTNIGTNAVTTVVVSSSVLNSPWGIAFAPSHFGTASGNVLIGNFGDGTINVFNLITGEFLGALTLSDGSTLVLPNLWSLDFGRTPPEGRFDFEATSLTFTAGINKEADGLIGTIKPINPFLRPLR